MTDSRSPSYTVLTPTGKAAIATVRVDAPDLFARLAPVFSPAARWVQSGAEEGRVAYGSWCHSATAVPEDVVVHSLGSHRAEIHCHGGIAAVHAICRTLNELGFAPVAEGDLPELLGMSEWQTEVARALAMAPTRRTAQILLSQWHRCDTQLETWQQQLATNPDAARAEIQRALSWQRFGGHLWQPWSVVLAGLPNAGKSSLINALAGYRRALVHATPGTTRDVVSLWAALEGWPVEIRDTAGIRESRDAIESEGIERARASIATADLFVWVVDASEPLSLEDNARPEPDLPPPDLIVENKIDLLSSGDRRAMSGLPSIPMVRTSAVEGTGIEELGKTIAHLLVPELPPSDLLFPINARTREILANLETNGSSSGMHQI